LAESPEPREVERARPRRGDLARLFARGARLALRRLVGRRRGELLSRSALARADGSMMPNERRILFVSECVTLAQVVRLVVLARALDPARYEVHFASGEFSPLVFAGTSFVRHELETVDARRVLAALEAGKRLYEKSTLERYVAAEF